MRNTRLPLPGRALAPLLLLLALAAGCRRTADPCADDDPAIQRVAVAPVTIERLETPFLQIRTGADARAFADRYPAFARQYLLRRQYPSDTAFGEKMAALATNDGFRQLAQSAQQTFGDLAPEREQLHDAFQHVKFYFPDFQPPRVYSFVSGLSQDIFVNDSLLVLGLDFFVGPKAPFRPNTYQYVLRRYQRPFMVPAAVLPISNKYLQQDFADKTLLNQMIQFGKAYYFLEKVLPCVPDSLKIGFTGKEIKGAVWNEQRIWSHFLNNKLLYSTQPFLVQKYVGERPNVPEIGKQCPGRIGQWVGWQIVRAYMAENPTVSLKELLAEKNAQKILDGSKYKPRKR